MFGLGILEAIVVGVGGVEVVAGAATAYRKATTKAATPEGQEIKQKLGVVPVDLSTEHVDMSGTGIQATVELPGGHGIKVGLGQRSTKTSVDKNGNTIMRHRLVPVTAKFLRNIEGAEKATFEGIKEAAEVTVGGMLHKLHTLANAAGDKLHVPETTPESAPQG